MGGFVSCDVMEFRSFKPKTKFSKQITKQHDIHHDHSVRAQLQN